MNKFELEIKANQLAQKISTDGGNLDSAYKQMEIEMETIQKSMPIQALIPGEEAIGFAKSGSGDGKSFWNIYSKSVRSKLCDPDGKLHKIADLGLSTSAGAIATEIVGILAFPPSAIGLAIPIAAILATTGLDAYCEWTTEVES